MSYLLPTLGRKLRQVCTAGLLLMGLQAAWAIQPMIGDFRQVLNTPTDTLTIWRTASNPDVFIFDFPSLTSKLSLNDKINPSEKIEMNYVEYKGDVQKDPNGNVLLP